MASAGEQSGPSAAAAPAALGARPAPVLGSAVRTPFREQLTPLSARASALAAPEAAGVSGAGLEPRLSGGGAMVGGEAEMPAVGLLVEEGLAVGAEARQGGEFAEEDLAMPRVAEEAEYDDGQAREVGPPEDARYACQVKTDLG